MSQSLHLPEMGEGLSNPLYPYFQSSQKNSDKQHLQKTFDNVGDTDLLQAYGLDFNKFSLANGDSSTKNTTTCNQNMAGSSINNIDTLDSFSLTLNTPAIKSQSNWTKFE